jgi:hypothetical protein
MELWSLCFRARYKRMAVANSAGTEDVTREGRKLEASFHRLFVFHWEQLSYVCHSVEEGECLAALPESGRMSCRARGREQERATLPRLRKARYSSNLKRRRPQVSSNAFTCVRKCNIEINRPVVVESPLRIWLQYTLHTLASKFASRRTPLNGCVREPRFRCVGIAHELKI